MFVAITLLLSGSSAAQTQESQPTQHLAHVTSLNFVQPRPTHDYDQEVLIPLHKAQAEARAKQAAAEAAAQEQARQAALAAQQAQAAAQAQLAAQQAIQAAYIAANVSSNDAKLFIYLHESGNVPCKINGGAIDCNYNGNRACGIGQALPCQKLTAVCPLTDYACQDGFFTQYAIARYGSWVGAYNFWQQHHWW